MMQNLKVSIGLSSTIAACLVPAVALAKLPGSDSSLHESRMERYKVMQLSVPKDTLSMQQFAAKTSGIDSCSDAKSLAKELGGSVRVRKSVTKGLTAKPLLDAIDGLESGDTTRVYSTQDTHFVLVMCGLR